MKVTGEEKIFLNDFTGGHIDRWKHYLLTNKFENTGKPLNENTTNRYLTKLRAIFNKAMTRDIITRSPFANFKIKEVAGQRAYLTLDELNRLAKHNLGGNIALQRVRDAFVFSCYCPIRFNDLMKLRINNFYTDDEGITWVAYNAQKTKTDVEMPLFKEAETLYRKYADTGRREGHELLFHKMSNQRFNSALTVIMNLVGITNKKISHHSAKHTAGTTILLGRGIGIRETAFFLSHKSLSSTMVYTKLPKSTMAGVVKRIDKLA